MSSLREDEVSQRIFYGGLFGLPWLWMVHAMGYYSKQRNTDGLLNTNNEGAGDVDPSVAENQLTWVTRCRNCAVLATIAWIVWIIIVQFAMKDSFPDSWYVTGPDQAEYTGW